MLLPRFAGMDVLRLGVGSPADVGVLDATSPHHLIYRSGVSPDPPRPPVRCDLNVTSRTSPDGYHQTGNLALSGNPERTVIASPRCWASAHNRSSSIVVQR